MATPKIRRNSKWNCLKKMIPRAANGINAISISAAILGSVLTIAIYRAIARRLASA